MEEKKELKDIHIAPKNNPILDGLSEYVKNPANYTEIKKKLLDTLATKCTHSDLLAYSACKSCTNKMLERRRLLKKLGFKSAAQYMAWQKVHEKIQERFPLVDWKKVGAVVNK